MEVKNKRRKSESKMKSKNISTQKRHVKNCEKWESASFGKSAYFVFPLKNDQFPFAPMNLLIFYCSYFIIYSDVYK